MMKDRKGAVRNEALSFRLHNAYLFYERGFPDISKQKLLE